MSSFFFNALNETLLCLALVKNLNGTPPVERVEVLTQAKLNNVLAVED